MEQIEGKVINIIYESDNGFKIINIEIGNRILTLKGSLPTVEIGDNIKASGKYVEHKDFGMQFDVNTFEKVFPEGSDSILEYLESGAIKGIGPKTAKKIVDKFGENTLNIMYENPELLAEITGISKQKAIDMGAEFREKREFFDIVEFLKPYNLSMNEVNKLYGKYKSMTINLLRENPYIILNEVTSVKFNDIDRIALNEGISLNSENRLKAAIMHAMNLSLRNGHTFVKYGSLVSFVKSVTSAEEEYIEKCVKELSIRRFLDVIKEKDYDLSEDAVEEKEEKLVCLEPLSIAESEIAEKLSIINETKLKTIVGIDSKIKDLEKERKIELTESQREAIKAVNDNNITIITGGPGTGKTTITKFIVKLFFAAGKKIEIAAPTGKAAKRISDVTGHGARTIHRMLDIGKYEDEFDAIFLEVNKIFADVIIIDEASMLDTMMMTYILRAINKDARLVLIGDINQLPSVGAGQVLKDLIASEKITTVILNKIFRQASKSNIIINAHRVNEGKEIAISKTEDSINDLEISFINSQEYMFNELINRLMIEFQYYDFTEFFLNSQILTITKKGKCGTLNLNEEIQERFNKLKDETKKIRYGKVEYRINDRIMQIKNDYDKVWEYGSTTGIGVFNGEMGWIKAINQKEKEIAVEFDDGKEAIYTKEDLDKITHAYAITVHKSQGSEFDIVILILPNTVPVLLTRNILYTGISRAKKKLIIIGAKNTIDKMIDTMDTNKRNTLLKEKIRESINIEKKIK